MMNDEHGRARRLAEPVATRHEFCHVRRSVLIAVQGTGQRIDDDKARSADAADQPLHGLGLTDGDPRGDYAERPWRVVDPALVEPGAAPTAKLLRVSLGDDVDHFLGWSSRQAMEVTAGGHAERQVYGSERLTGLRLPVYHGQLVVDQQPLDQPVGIGRGEYLV